MALRPGRLTTAAGVCAVTPSQHRQTSWKSGTAAEAAALGLAVSAAGAVFAGVESTGTETAGASRAGLKGATGVAAEGWRGAGDGVAASAATRVVRFTTSRGLVIPALGLPGLRPRPSDFGRLGSGLRSCLRFPGGITCPLPSSAATHRARDSLGHCPAGQSQAGQAQFVPGRAPRYRACPSDGR
jgi:hypothetical protein